MKQNSEKRESKYAKKKRRDKMMYGPGCCAHSVTAAQIQAAKDAARKAGTVRGWDV